ncbi:MAG: hypothetical protein IJ849_02315 [Selenomonadaceae bacterium]|nr:hypothetical protein [Selenomonadaceae bacterium]
MIKPALIFRDLEHQFDRSGLVDPCTAAQLGKMLGAKYLLIGMIKVEDWSDFTEIVREGL